MITRLMSSRVGSRREVSLSKNPVDKVVVNDSEDFIDRRDTHSGKEI